MNLHKLILTENACYKTGRKITPKGIMVHSTGANNPNLCRYVNPNDGLLGENKYGNHWNQDKPGGSYVCVHAFIGKLADGTIATYQTLPWDWRGWHAGNGSIGSANDTHISFEICEDDLTDSSYFAAVYQEAVELCAYLCKKYDLTEKDILCHSEGYERGIASNHSDVMHWFPKHGKSMDTFRADVKKLLDGDSSGEINRPDNSKPDTGEKPAAPSEIKVGSTVKIKAGAKYTNGVDVPDSIIRQTYTVQQVNGSKALLKEIVSWVGTSYLTAVSNGTEPDIEKPDSFYADTEYRVRAGGKWYPAVKNLDDYAGKPGVPITDVAIKASKGSVKYRVHVKGGEWLPYVTGYDIRDAKNGYAGDGKVIDAIEAYYYTPDGIKPYRKAKYRVSPLNGSYWPWQYDNETTDGQDGYAGTFGKPIDRLQIAIVAE